MSVPQQSSFLALKPAYAVYININILALVLPTPRAFGRTQSPPLHIVIFFYVCPSIKKIKNIFGIPTFTAFVFFPLTLYHFCQTHLIQFCAAINIHLYIYLFRFAAAAFVVRCTDAISGRTLIPSAKFRKAYFYFCSTERNSELFSLPRNGSERNSESFASIFVPQYGIPSIFLFLGMVRNGISRVLRSAEQPEFRRNKPIVPPIPSSAE